MPYAIASYRLPAEGRARSRRTAGFSFVELLLVMGVMAVLMALSIGYLGNMGKTSEVAQAKALITETAFRCINASMGSQRAFFILREDAGPDADGGLVIEAGLAGTVLTHQFERLDYASDGRVGEISGNVELKPDEGHTGSGGLFKGGGLIFPAESSFAMTEGLEWEAWLRPDAGPSGMTVLKGMGASEAVYQISLIRGGTAPAYDVKVRLSLREAEPRGHTVTAPMPRTYETVGAPVPADGRTWTHVAVMFDGREVRVFVGGVEVPLRGDLRSKDKGAPTARMRINVPSTGVVKLAIGGDSRGFKGMMDSVILRGVFRSSENSHELPERLQLISPRLPVRIEYANGRLSGTSAQSIALWFKDLAFPDDLPLRIVLGRSGTVDAAWTDEGRPPPPGARGQP